MKKPYNKIEISIDVLSQDDVITASGFEPTKPTNPTEHENAFEDFWDF